MTDPATPEPSPAWANRLERLRSVLPVRLSRATLAAGVAGAAVVVVAVALVVLYRSGAPAPLVLPRAGGAPAPASDLAPPGADHAADTITVYAAGAVARPGVYVVPSRARVADVLAAAGGSLPDATIDQLNLAAKVTDAERIYVPRKGEASTPVPPDSPPGGSPTGGGGPGSVGPIDLNTADATQLDVLPGVGPTTAKAIVAYRSAHGRFRSVTDLLGVPGIGPAKLDAIRPLVTVNRE